MKMSGYILAFYLVLLSAVPCCAFDSCPDDRTEQSTKHEANDGDCGNCSPFFSCEGCAAAMIDYQPAHFELHTITQSAVHSSYTQSDLPRVDYDVWQPPKIG